MKGAEALDKKRLSICLGQKFVKHIVQKMNEQSKQTKQKTLLTKIVK